MKKEDLKIGKFYLIKTKSYGIIKVEFKGFEYIEHLESEYAKFNERLGLSWLMEIEDIESDVFDFVEVI